MVFEKAVAKDLSLNVPFHLTLLFFFVVTTVRGRLYNEPYRTILVA